MTHSQHQPIKSLNTSSGLKRFTFKSNSRRIQEININVYRSLETRNAAPKSATFLLDELLKQRELNTAEDFMSFYDEMMPLVQTSELVLYHKEKIFSELLSRLNMKALLSLEPILELVAALCRDVLQEFLEKPKFSDKSFLERFTDCIVDLLKDGGCHNPETLEQVFTSWHHIIEFLQKYLAKDVINVLNVTAPLRFFENDYVQDFMADAVSFLLRTLSKIEPATELRKGMRSVIFEVAESSSSIKRNGTAALLFHAMKGTSSKLHSKAEKVFQMMISKPFLSISNTSHEGLEAVLEVITDVIQRLWMEVDHNEFNKIFECLIKEISSSISDGCMMHLNRLLSLLRTTISQCNKSQVYDSKTLLEIARKLIESYVVPNEDMKSGDQYSEVINEILELILCLLDNPSISSNLSNISLDFAPVFKLKNLELAFIKRLLLKDPLVVHGFKCQIISSMNNLIKESPEEVLFTMLIFFEGENLQPFSSLSVVSAEEASKLCDYFKETLSSWVKILNDVALSNKQSDISFSESNLAVLWGVLKCYPHIQHLNDSASLVNNLIGSLDQLLEIDADTIAGFPKSTWQSLLGAALFLYHKLLLASKTRVSEISTFLKLAKRYKSSTQVLFAVAEFLDSLFGGMSATEAGASKKEIHDLDTDEAVIAFSLFSDNLRFQNKETRLLTLRILSHYAPLDSLVPTSEEPPHKKIKTEESDSSRELCQNVCVIDLILSIEMTPISVSTSRKIVNAILRLQKSISSSSLNQGYIPLVLNGIIGMLHNRLSYIWEPASTCLAILLRRYKDLLWDTFIQYLDNYQLGILSSGVRLEKMNVASSQDNTLVGRLHLFLAPNFDNTPCVTVINQLLKSLQEVHELAESQSQKIVPIFLKFLGYSDEAFSSVEAYSNYNCSGKEWRLVLKEWLNLFKLMRNVRSLYRNQVLKEVLSSRLLDEIDSEIQLKVLDCLLNWKDDFLAPYDQHLKNMIISRNLRDELTRWPVSKDSQYIQENHRGSLIPILIRLLTPKVRNLKTLGSRKHTSVSHRRAVLCFLTQLEVDELHLFFSLLLNPFLLGPRTNATERPQSTLMKCSNKNALTALSWKKKYGFLHVTEDILSTFDELHLRPFLTQLMTIVVQILKSCTLSLADDTKFHETDTQASMSMKQHKDLRSLCLKNISFAISKYDNHDFGSDFWETFFNAVRPLINGFKQEGSSSEKASSLFSCFIAMSRSPILVSLLAQEADLVPNIFSILTVKTASGAIISSVLNFIENLLTMDDPKELEKVEIKKVLFPHLTLLINCFHGFFQSRKNNNRKSFITFGKTELKIFKLLMKYINDPLTAEQFVDILLPICKKKFLNSDECLEALHIIKGILPVAGEKIIGKVLIAISPLIVSAKLDSRLCICEILEGLSRIDPSLTTMARLLNELNAMSSVEIDELDYDRRINAYNNISVDMFSSFKEEQTVMILSQCMHDMSSEETILRQSASKSLLSFIQFASLVLDNLEENEEMVININWTKACIQRTLKKTFLQNIGEAMYKDNSIKKEWIVLLRDMICHLHRIPSLSSFKTLCSEDPEKDFFNNIVHLQAHRRGRALTRFRNAVNSGSLSESVVVKIFVPLFFNMMLDVKDGKGEHLRNACSTTLASISGQMQWDNYCGFLMKCFKEMKCKPDKGKLMIRLICEVLDMFHFSRAGENSSNVSLEIQVCLQKQVFPKLMKLVESDSEKVNVNASLAALKLLKFLPEKYMEAQLHSIIKRICNFLKHPHESIRDEARSALASCATELGIERFHLIIKDLRSTLQRGSHLHILGYTIYFILSKMLTDPSIGKLDHCLEELLSITENDIFGDVAEQKDVENFASKMKETKKKKSFETLKLISQSITFKTHATKLLSPISLHLQKHLTPKSKLKLEQMLHQIALGIESNPSTELFELLKFVYKLIQEGIKESSLLLKNNHLIVVFALGVLNNRLKNMKLDRKDGELLSRLDPFVQLLGECLNSKYEGILSTSFRCLGPLIKLPLPSLSKQADKIKIILLDISQRSSNATNPLVQSCLKLLTVLLQSTMISLSDDQLRVIIRFPMFFDLLTNPSPIALSLLNSIIGRKLVVPEIYDIVLRVAELMVTSHSEPIRKKCSKIFFQFLVNYQLKDKRKQQHIDFLLSNLNYEHSSGREAVLEMLHIILIKLPPSFIDNQAQTFFLHLVVALANESDQKVRSMVSTVLRELISRASSEDLNLFLDYSLSWYMGEKQHLWSASAQVLGLLVVALKKGFQGHTASILQAAKHIFTLAINAMTKIGFKILNDSGIPFWKEAYSSLVMLDAMLKHLNLYFDGNLEEIWEMILKFLLHPHVWLRNISNRLVALHFSAISDAAAKNPDFKAPYLANSSKLFNISVSLLNQLKGLLSDEDATNNVIIQNLVFSICNLHTFSIQKSMLLIHDFWSALQHQDQTTYLEAFQFLGSNKAKDAFVLATNEIRSKQDNNNNLQSLLVAPLIKRMGKIATEMEDVQMKIVFYCFKMISSQIGPQAFQYYAFYLLMPIYKVCEGFVGKIVSDEMKQLAEEVRDAIRNQMGVDKFVEIYNEIRKKLKGKREKRKHGEIMIASVNPMRHAKRKLRIAEKHRAHKKRKIMSLKMSKWSR